MNELVYYLWVIAIQSALYLGKTSLAYDSMDKMCLT